MVDKLKKRHHTRPGVLQPLIWPSKGKEKDKKLLQHGYLYLVTHPGTSPDEQGSTL